MKALHALRAITAVVFIGSAMYVLLLALGTVFSIATDAMTR